jgi:hypothetical protein
MSTSNNQFKSYISQDEYLQTWTNNMPQKAHDTITPTNWQYNWWQTWRLGRWSYQGSGSWLTVSLRCYVSELSTRTYIWAIFGGIGGNAVGTISVPLDSIAERVLVSQTWVVFIPARERLSNDWGCIWLIFQRLRTEIHSQLRQERRGSSHRSNASTPQNGAQSCFTDAILASMGKGLFMAQLEQRVVYSRPSTILQ